MGEQSTANVNALGLTPEQGEIRNVVLNPVAKVSSLVDLYPILSWPQVSTLLLATSHSTACPALQDGWSPSFERGFLKDL